VEPGVPIVRRTVNICTGRGKTSIIRGDDVPRG